MMTVNFGSRSLFACCSGVLFACLMVAVYRHNFKGHANDCTFTWSEPLSETVPLTSGYIPETREYPRIFCYLNTFKRNYDRKAIHAFNTWGRKCSKTVFTSQGKHPKLPLLDLDLKGVREIRRHLWVKMRLILREIHGEVDSFDYFFKGDDDTYVFVENLRDLLMNCSRDDPFETGYIFQAPQPTGFCSGGAGYVLSQAALRLIIEKAINKHPDCPTIDEAHEDVKISVCGNAVGVEIRNSLDESGTPLFYLNHPGSLLRHYRRDVSPKNYETPYIRREKFGPSPRHVSFHYMSAHMMYAVEFIAYHLRPVGIENGEELRIHRISPCQ